MANLKRKLIKIKENEEKLKKISQKDGLLFEPVYFKLGFSKNKNCYLRERVIKRLKKAQSLLPQGLRIKIFDGYRPLIVQERMFKSFLKRIKRKYPHWSQEKILKETLKFAALPLRDLQNPPPHSTGGAVDLTLIDEKGRELEMGTPFDDLSLKASPFYYERKKNLTPKEKIIKKNRQILRKVMQKVDFVIHPREWWHFEYGTLRWAKRKKKNYAFYGLVKKNNKL